jgi:hypothetical protein
MIVRAVKSKMLNSFGCSDLGIFDEVNEFFARREIGA